MRIVVFGAAGNVGRRVVVEALSRGHEVAAVVRDPLRFAELPRGAKACWGDAGNIGDVVARSTGQDVVIGATRPAAGHERELVASTRTLLAGVARTGARLLLVGGAATLTIPGKGGTTVLDDPHFLSPEYRPIGRACADQLAICRAEPNVDWTYLSPAANLEPGERTTHFRLGTDELLLDANGESRISIEDLAVALLDEVEEPRHKRTRFTVGY